MGSTKSLFMAFELLGCLESPSSDDLNFGFTGVPCTVLEDKQETTKKKQAICRKINNSYFYRDLLSINPNLADRDCCQ